MLQSVSSRFAIPTAGLAALLIVSAGILAGCGFTGVSGQGPTTTEARPVEAFTRVAVDYGISVEIRNGPAAPVEIEAPANIRALITTTVADGTLHITSTAELGPLVRVKAIVVTEGLAGIALSGGSQGIATDLVAHQLDIDLTGGAVLNAIGTAGTVTLRSSGGSEAHFNKLVIGTLDVELSGGASVLAVVSDEVRGSASGGAEVIVMGDALLNVQASGGASVDRL